MVRRRKRFFDLLPHYAQGHYIISSEKPHVAAGPSCTVSLAVVTCGAVCMKHSRNFCSSCIQASHRHGAIPTNAAQGKRNSMALSSPE